MEPVEKQREVNLILEWFGYNPDRGILIRKLKTRSDAHDEINPERQSVHFNSKWYDYATLCWIVYYKAFPKNIVDHKDQIRVNHKITNLRDATATQNQQNKAGYGLYAKGVTWRNRIEKPYQAKIRVNGDRIHLGSFATEEEAAQAYRDAAVKYHGEFACLV